MGGRNGRPNTFKSISKRHKMMINQFKSPVVFGKV